MPLPVTKGEFNRLGDRLCAAEHPSEVDLQALATVLEAYQEVLERVKGQLRELGFAAAGRVKTTKTMTEKLRRTPGMELSRVQDLAGARIVVRDLAAQDAAQVKISESFVAQGYGCRVVDRKKDPRFGYKAVHVIVRIDEMPVEIQIRTELQDTWAQIFERLGDRWGRGIRYGQDPANPESMVRSGEFATSRREAVALLMTLSDAISAVEETRRQVDDRSEGLRKIAAMFGEDLYSKADPEKLVNKIPAEMLPVQAVIADLMTKYSQELDAEAQGLLEAGSDITGAQLMRMVEITTNLLGRRTADRAADLHRNERQLRDILQLIADATDEGA
jgi:ppGpp synthetase/RelA/SpoT-type nucleotidyltranferase